MSALHSHHWRCRSFNRRIILDAHGPWGYTIYIRKNSPYPRFYIELGADEKIKNIMAKKP
jgi:hypothetical protein